MLEVGWVVKPHGIRGEVVVAAVTNVPERRFVAGAVLSSERGSLEVVSARPHQGRWLVTFAGVSDRNAAEALRGVTLSGEPLEGEGDDLWVHELVGCEVVDVRGRSYGPVEAVEANPAADLLVLAGESERLVPLTFVVTHEPGRIVIDPPPGLLD